MRRLIHLTFALVLGAIAFSPAATAAEGASVRALLITASKEKAASDPQLSEYIATLKSVLPFTTFKLSGQGSASVAGKGTASISLPSGHRVQLSDGTRAGGGIKVRVDWTNNGQPVMGTSLTLQPGVPAVLGRGGEGEVPVVLLIAR